MKFPSSENVWNRFFVICACLSRPQRAESDHYTTEQEVSFPGKEEQEKKEENRDTASTGDGAAGDDTATGDAANATGADSSAAGATAASTGSEAGDETTPGTGGAIGNMGS